MTLWTVVTYLLIQAVGSYAMKMTRSGANHLTDASRRHHCVMAPRTAVIIQMRTNAISLMTFGHAKINPNPLEATGSVMV